MKISHAQNTCQSTSMSAPTQSAIVWPTKFLPGTTDNFTSNETIAKGVSAQQVWGLLSNISQWESYYDNVSDITPPSSGPELQRGDVFKFSTFGWVLSSDRSDTPVRRV